MLHTRSYYYMHKNIDHVGVCRVQISYYIFNDLTKLTNGEIFKTIGQGILSCDQMNR